MQYYNNCTNLIRESVDSLCRDGANVPSLHPFSFHEMIFILVCIAFDYHYESMVLLYLSLNAKMSMYIGILHDCLNVHC